MSKALITGASSGLGVVFAHELAKEGYSLVLVARREEKLKELCETIKIKYNVSAEYIVQDLGTIEGAKSVCEKIDDVDFLVNNAGFGTLEEFSKIDMSKELSMIDLNVETLYYFTKFYGLKMADKKSGGIINIASTAAFQPIPRFAVYGATKAFVLSFTEAVSKELESSGVRVMALCPGPTTTEFFSIAKSGEDFKMNPRMFMTADDVVKQGLKAFKKGKRVFVPGFVNRLTSRLVSFLPRESVLKFSSKVLK